MAEGASVCVQRRCQNLDTVRTFFLSRNANNANNADAGDGGTLKIARG